MISHTEYVIALHSSSSTMLSCYVGISVEFSALNAAGKYILSISQYASHKLTTCYS